jgi:hypothetical protein
VVQVSGLAIKDVGVAALLGDVLGQKVGQTTGTQHVDRILLAIGVEITENEHILDPALRPDLLDEGR